MKLHFDENKIKESIESNAYDNRNLTVCKCGKHHYPSKLMFIRFLEKFKDVEADVDIWSEKHWDTGEVDIHVDLKYKIADVEEKENP